MIEIDRERVCVCLTTGEIERLKGAAPVRSKGVVAGEVEVEGGGDSEVRAFSSGRLKRFGIGGEFGDSHVIRELSG